MKPPSIRVSLGRVIAERVYNWRTAAGTRSVTVRLGQPVRDRKAGGDWLCPVSFRGAPRGLLRSGSKPVYGVDALQALLLACGYVQQELARLQRSEAGELTWLGTRDLGLPDILALVGVRRVFRAGPPLSSRRRAQADEM